MAFYKKIIADLKESQITWGVAAAIVPIAFFSYFFHEFGHWTFGEWTGNDMAMSLNNAAPRNGSFLHESDALWSAIGGPLFTVVQALIFLWISGLTKSIYAYSFVFMAAFIRFFAIVFGGIDLQDEARIAFMLQVNKYLIAIFVLAVLFWILWRCSKLFKLHLRALGYYTILATFAVLLVIAVDQLTR